MAAPEPVLILPSEFVASKSLKLLPNTKSPVFNVCDHTDFQRVPADPRVIALSVLGEMLPAKVEVAVEVDVMFPAM